ncbi:hypothetical protein [Spirosoma areae]
MPVKTKIDNEVTAPLPPALRPEGGPPLREGPGVRVSPELATKYARPFIQVNDRAYC